jgi:DNA-binding MarR family transcriptional regulator
MDEGLDRLETQMAVLARRIEHTARQSTIFRQMDRAAYLIARTLDDGGPASVNEIAHVLSLDGSTVTRQVASMEARGQATRKVHPDDGRAWVISLTPSGRKKMETISAQRRVRFAHWLADWTQADLDAFGTLLQRFNDSLAKAAPLEPQPPPEADRAANRRGDHRQSVLAPRRSR